MSGSRQVQEKNILKVVFFSSYILANWFNNWKQKTAVVWLPSVTNQCFYINIPGSPCRLTFLRKTSLQFKAILYSSAPQDQNTLLPTNGGGLLHGALEREYLLDPQHVSLWKIIAYCPSICNLGVDFSIYIRFYTHVIPKKL